MNNCQCETIICRTHRVSHPDHMMLVIKVRGLEDLTPVMSVIVIWQPGVSRSQIPGLEEGQVFTGNV